MAAKLPKDDNGFTIPVLYPETPRKASPSGSSVKLPITQGVSIIRIVATAAMNFKLGDDSVTAAATDHYIPAGIPFDIKTNGKTHIAAIGTGDFYVSEMS